MFFTSNVLHSLGLLQLKTAKSKQGKQITQPKSYKTEIKIFANTGFAWSGFEPPGPVW